MSMGKPIILAHEADVCRWHLNPIPRDRGVCTRTFSLVSFCGKNTTRFRLWQVRHGGASYEAIHEECPEELREAIFSPANPIVPWLRAPEFRMVTFKHIIDVTLEACTMQSFNESSTPITVQRTRRSVLSRRTLSSQEPSEPRPPELRKAELMGHLKFSHVDDPHMTQLGNHMNKRFEIQNTLVTHHSKRLVFCSDNAGAANIASELSQYISNLEISELVIGDSCNALAVIPNHLRREALVKHPKHGQGTVVGYEGVDLAHTLKIKVQFEGGAFHSYAVKSWEKLTSADTQVHFGFERPRGRRWSMPTCGQAATKATEVMAAEAPSAVSPVSTITGPPDQPSESAARNVVQSQVASEWVAKQAVATSEAMRDIFLLVLNDKTWEAGASSERLAALFNSVLVLKKYSRIPAKILLVHVVDPSIGGVLQFDHFFQVTPSDLLAMGIVSYSRAAHRHT